jgi:hypothetical protein
MSEREQKITFDEMRESGVRSVVIYCADYLSVRPLDHRPRRWLAGRYAVVRYRGSFRLQGVRAASSGS